MLGHWLREIRRWAPPIRVVVLHRASGQAFKEASSGGAAAAAVAARQRSSGSGSGRGGAGNRIKHHAARAFVEQWIQRAPPRPETSSDSDNDDSGSDEGGNYVHQSRAKEECEDDALGAVVSALCFDFKALCKLYGRDDH